MKDQLLRALVAPFPPDSIFRRVGKRLCRGLSVKQNYYGGVIYFDAVGQSWAFKGTPYETIDTDLKNALLSRSKECRYFIDIGCNIGLISLSVLLRNNAIKVICVDPNPEVLRLLKRSLRANRLEQRATVKNLAVGNESGTVRFSSEISEMGHIASEGYEVECVRLADLLRDYSADPCLLKIDVEGFETVLLQGLRELPNLPNLTLALEVHALGYNQGNPVECLRLLLESGAAVAHLDGAPVASLDSTKITQVIAQWKR